MDDAALVRGFQRLGDLPRDRERVVQRDAAAAPSAAPGPRPSTYSMTSAAWAFQHAVDLRDVGWLSAASIRASRSKRARRSGSGGKNRWKDLDRDVPIELRVARPIDLAHATCPDGSDDLVAVEPRPRDQWHVVVPKLYRGHGLTIQATDFTDYTDLKRSGIREVPVIRGLKESV